MTPQQLKNLIAQNKQSAQNNTQPHTNQMALNLAAGGPAITNSLTNSAASQAALQGQKPSGNSPSNASGNQVAQVTSPIPTNIPMPALPPPPTGSSLPKGIIDPKQLPSGNATVTIKINKK